MKNLIQIGLNESCEYIYVTEPNWPRLQDENSTPEFPFIPKELWEDGEPWNYYGVDMNERNIENLAEEFSGRNHTFFLHALVHERDQQEVNHNGWCVGKGDSVLKSTSLERLFDSTCYPNALVMDVENSELPILHGYSWQHKPEFMSIETHSIDATSGVIRLLLNLGYYLTDYEAGASEVAKIINVSFLREDITSEETKNLWAYR